MSTFVRLSTFLILALCTGLAFLGPFHKAADQLGPRQLQSHNEAYLESAQSRALKTFAVLSGLKAGLDIIEGSQVGASIGASAELEVGDVAQPAYDYVDVSWRTLLAGSVTLIGLGFLLQAADLVANPMLTGLLTFATAGALLHLLIPDAVRLRRWCRDVVGVGLIAWLALAYVLPLSVFGSAKLSATITATAIAEAEVGYQQIKNELFPETTDEPENWVTKIKGIPGYIEQVAGTLKRRAPDFMIWTTRMIAGYLFDCILFPILLFVLLMWLTRSAVSYIFQKSIHRSLCDELERRWNAKPH